LIQEIVTLVKALKKWDVHKPTDVTEIRIPRKDNFIQEIVYDSQQDVLRGRFQNIVDALMQAAKDAALSLDTKRLSNMEVSGTNMRLA